MKQGTFARSRRLGSAMGRVAQGGPRENPADIFEYAVQLAVSRQLLKTDNITAAWAFADAFLVSWLRARGRRHQASRVRRGLEHLRLAPPDDPEFGPDPETVVALGQPFDRIEAVTS